MSYNWVYAGVWTTCGDVGAVWFFMLFLTPRLNYFLQFSTCNLWRVFGHSNSPPHRALGWYKHTSFSRQICNVFSWLKSLNYYPDGGHGNFHCTSSILTATFYFVKLNYVLLNIRNIFLGFTPCDGRLRECGLCVPHIYNPVEQEVMAGQLHRCSLPGVLKNGNIFQIYFILYSFYGCQ